MRLAYVRDSEKRTELLCGWVWICGWGFIYINGFIYIYVYTFIRIYVYTVWKIKTSFRSLRIFIGSSKLSGKMCALSKKPVQFCLFNVKLHDGSVYFRAFVDFSDKPSDSSFRRDCHRTCVSCMAQTRS